MSPSQFEVIDIDIHQTAVTLAREYINEFAVSLLLQAKTLAFQRRADIVLSTHVEEARNIVLSETQKSWPSDLKLAFGGALLGTSFQGFANEISLSPVRPFWTGVYFIVSLFGAFLIFWGLRR